MSLLKFILSIVAVAVTGEYFAMAEVLLTDAL
jgi:hypothetical protein